MNIKTKYNLGDTASFNAFGQKNLRISGEIVGISACAQTGFHKEKKIKITYSVNVTLEKKTEPWNVDEKSIIFCVKGKK